MVQALAFAEIFLGLILADAGYKGVTVSSVVKGEAENAKPKGLGEGASTVFSPTGSTDSSSSTLPSPAPATFGFTGERERLETIQKNRSFGPSPENSPSALTAPIGSKP